MFLLRILLPVLMLFFGKLFSLWLHLIFFSLFLVSKKFYCDISKWEFFFVFILLGAHRNDCICSFISFINFGKFSTLISSNIALSPFSLFSPWYSTYMSLVTSTSYFLFYGFCPFVPQCFMLDIFFLT